MNILVQFLESEVSAGGTKQSHDLYLQHKDQEGVTKCPLPFGKPPCGVIWKLVASVANFSGTS